MNNDTRTSNSVKNISFGMISQVVQMLLGFVSRTIFIKFLAVEYLGLNSLFTNILTMLSLAELGVGTAIVYSLYQPLANKEEREVATIITFYKKVYSGIGIFVFCIGLILLPFLSHIIPAKPHNIVEDVRLIYFIFLFNSSATYFFSYKQSILDADQKSSVATLTNSAFLIFQNVLQILILYFTQNYILFLVTQVLCAIASNYYIARIVDKRYPYLSNYKSHKVDKELKNKIIANTKATFYVKIGGLLVNSTDNLIINYFVGLAVLGKFSNYVMLIAMASNFLVIIFNNIKSSVANFIITETKEKQNEMFKSLNFFTFWIYGLSAVFLITLINDFITLWVGAKYVLSFNVVLILAINFFMYGMQYTFWTFKIGYGYFNHGKYLVLLTALINLILSFILGYFYGIFGVLLATAIARFVTNFWYDPYITIKLGLENNPVDYIFVFLKYIVILSISIVTICSLSSMLHFTLFVTMVIKFCFCLVIPNLIIIVVYRKKPEFQKIYQMAVNAFLVLTKRIKT